MTDITEIFERIESGDKLAAEQLFPVVYDELRRIAAAKLRNEYPGQTLQATALVHEAYFKLVGGQNVQQWQGRNHFFGAAAEAMRRILVDNARRKQSQKRGGDQLRIEFDSQVPSARHADKILALDEALEKLDAADPEKAALVKLRFFVGMTIQEAATALGISTSTADRHWSYARSWLQREMQGP